MSVRVVYALPERSTEIDVALPQGATVAEALARSTIGQRHPELDLARCPVGVFGKRVAREFVLTDGDRVEIYRTLLADPKAARRRRAGKCKHE